MRIASCSHFGPSTPLLGTRWGPTRGQGMSDDSAWDSDSETEPSAPTTLVQGPLVVKSKSGSSVQGRRNATAKSTGGKSSANKSPDKNVLKPCLACDEPRYRKMRWCLMHRRGYDIARSQEAAKGPEALKKFELKMANDTTASEAMKWWCKYNPCSRKWAKKEVVDWIEYEKKHGTKKTKRTRGKKKMMTRKNFCAYGRYKMGWDTDSIDSEWGHIVNTAKEKDNLGRKGETRYEVDLGKTRHSDDEDYVDSAAKEGTSRVKKPKVEDREALRHFAQTGAAAWSDAFFHGSAKVDQAFSGHFVAPPSPPSNRREHKGEELESGEDPKEA